MKKLLVLTGVIGIAALTGCYNDKADQLYPKVTTGCDTTSVTYAAVIQPIFTQKCATSGCHDAATKSGGYDYTSYNSSITTSVNSGALLGTITHNSNYRSMPDGQAKLDDCTINKITRWVNLGAPNN